MGWDLIYGIWEFFDTLDNDEFNVLVHQKGATVPQ